MEGTYIASSINQSETMFNTDLKKSGLNANHSGVRFLAGRSSFVMNRLDRATLQNLTVLATVLDDAHCLCEASIIDTINWKDHRDQLSVLPLTLHTLEELPSISTDALMRNFHSGFEQKDSTFFSVRSLAACMRDSRSLLSPRFTIELRSDSLCDFMRRVITLQNSKTFQRMRDKTPAIERWFIASSTPGHFRDDSTIRAIEALTNLTFNTIKYDMAEVQKPLHMRLSLNGVTSTDVILITASRDSRSAQALSEALDHAERTWMDAMLIVKRLLRESQLFNQQTII